MDSPDENPDALSRTEPDSLHSNFLITGIRSLKGWQAIPAAIIALYIILGIIGPWIAPFDPNQHSLSIWECPPLGLDWLDLSSRSRSAFDDECKPSYILGTDIVGRDVLSRWLHGARQSLSLVGFSIIIGTILGSAISLCLHRFPFKLRIVSYVLFASVIVPVAFFSIEFPHGLFLFLHSDDPINYTTHLIALTSISTLISFTLVEIASRTSRFQADLASRLADPNTYYWGQTFGYLRNQLFCFAPWIILSATISLSLIIQISMYMGLFNTYSETVWSNDLLMARDYAPSNTSYWIYHFTLVGISISSLLVSLWIAYRYLSARQNANSAANTDPSQDAELGQLPSLEPAAESSAPSDLIDESHVQQTQTTSQTKSVAATLKTCLSHKSAPIATVAVGSLLIFIHVAFIADLMPGPSQENIIRTAFFNSSYFTPQPERLFDCTQNPYADHHPGFAYDWRDPECVDMYMKYRNVPSHRLTFPHIARNITSVWISALLACVSGTAMAIISSASPTWRRFLLHGIVGIFGAIAILLFANIDWTRLVLIIGIDSGLMRQLIGTYLGLPSARVDVFRDMSAAIGISYLCVYTVIAHYRHSKSPINIPFTLKSALPLVIASIGITSTMLMLVHYEFPSWLLFYDITLSIIVTVPSDRTLITEEYVSELYSYSILDSSLLKHWLWTYWVVLIAYGVLVLSGLAVAIWGIRRFATKQTENQNPTISVIPTTSSQT